MNQRLKELTNKLRCPYVWIAAATVSLESPIGVFASDGKVDFSKASKPVVTLINSVLGPLISVVVALGAIWCVLLGVKLAKADEPQEREKAKMALKNAIVGFFLIFILIVVMRLVVPQLTGWVDTNSPGSTPLTPAVESK